MNRIFMYIGVIVGLAKIGGVSIGLNVMFLTLLILI